MKKSKYSENEILALKERLRMVKEQQETIKVLKILYCEIVRPKKE